MKKNLHLTKTSIKKNKKYKDISVILNRYYKKHYGKINYDYYIYLYGEYLFDSYKNYKVKHKSPKLLEIHYSDRKGVITEYEFNLPIEPNIFKTLRLKNQYSDDTHHFLNISIKLDVKLDVVESEDEDINRFTNSIGDVLLDFHLKHKIYFFFFQETDIVKFGFFSRIYQFLICVDGKYKKEEIVELKNNLNNLFSFCSSEIVVKFLYNSSNFFNQKMFYSISKIKHSEEKIFSVNIIGTIFCFFEYNEKLLDFYKIALHISLMGVDFCNFTYIMETAIIKKFYHGVREDYKKEANTLYFDKMEPRFDKDLISNLRYSYVYLPNNLKNIN